MVLRVRLVRGTGWDKVFRPAFGEPKNGWNELFHEHILGVFASHLPPGTGCSTSVEHNILPL
ncbi:hypothetical protein DVH24_031121 [Malus domestica]|uniref:Uncharacterized protein n=1 Tax=Malus domestica TaxID=3750 RepID=A0A498HBF9_MALDO|nr:hypothetical protein DVH24_031121 [Malus domestica]